MFKILLPILSFWLLTSMPYDARRADSLYRARMAEQFIAGDKEAFLETNRELIDFHKVQNNERQLFNAYATYLDRLQMWGRYDEAMTVLQEMSQQAQDRESALGAAVTEFCFGQFYLANRQPQEAQVHHRRAFRDLQALGEGNRALRSGFNLQAIAMNLEDPEAGLRINDSTQVLLEQLEQKYNRFSPDNRFKQARYRMVLLQRMGRMAEARQWKDSLLHYADILKDPSQDETMLTAIAQFEQASGNKGAAYACLDTLLQRAIRAKDYVKTARFRLALADFQRDNGDLALAVDNYHAFAAETDSAQVHLTNEQLNTLTKQYQLRELTMENAAARQRITALTVIAALLLVLSLAVFMYAQSLKRKNRALYLASKENIQAEEKAEEALVEHIGEQPTPEAGLYASLLALMKEEELFKNPELSRDDICARLGTNRTYLAEAVKLCSGLTLGGFINHQRLRWAAEALSSRDDVPVQAIGEDAGFSSRSTFNRLFQEQYGMSPSSYRSASRS